MNAGLLEQLLDLWGCRCPGLVNVLVKVLAGCVLGVLEIVEGLLALLGNLVGGRDGVVVHGVEVHVREVQSLFGAVVDLLPG